MHLCQYAQAAHMPWSVYYIRHIDLPVDRLVNTSKALSVLSMLELQVSWIHELLGTV